MKNAKVLILLLLGMFCTGCANNSYVKQFQDGAMKKVASVCDETVECYSSKIIDKETNHIVFYCTTKERDLHFEVETYKANGSQIYATNYLALIKEKYNERFGQEFSSSDITYDSDNNVICVYSLSDIQTVAAYYEQFAIEYAEENKYHQSNNFTINYPVFTNTICSWDDIVIGTISVTSEITADDVQLFLAESFSSKIGALE